MYQEERLRKTLETGQHFKTKGPKDIKIELGLGLSMEKNIQHLDQIRQIH